MSSWIMWVLKVNLWIRLWILWAVTLCCFGYLHELCYIHMIAKVNWGTMKLRLCKCSFLLQVGKQFFFVEAGAYDGEFLSNTLLFELQQHWTGLLVEPNKRIFDRLQTKHRKAWSLNSCLSTHPYPSQVCIYKTGVLRMGLKSSRKNESVYWFYRCFKPL